MSTTTPNVTPTDAFADIFGASVKVTRTSTVEIPATLREQFKRAVSAFAAAPNTLRVTQDMGSADAANLYSRQIRQYASEASRTALVKVTGTCVTWRFCKVTPSVRGKKRGSK